MSATAQFENVAPRDFLSAEYPQSRGVVIELAMTRPELMPNAAEFASEGLRKKNGIRAWFGWLGDDGVLRVAARTRP